MKYYDVCCDEVHTYECKDDSEEMYHQMFKDTKY